MIMADMFSEVTRNNMVCFLICFTPHFPSNFTPYAPFSEKNQLQLPPKNGRGLRGRQRTDTGYSQTYWRVHDWWNIVSNYNPKLKSSHSFSKF